MISRKADLTLEQALDAIQPKKGLGIGSRHWDGIHYVTVGGKVRTLDPNIDRESLRKLLVRDAPEASPPATTDEKHRASPGTATRQVTAPDQQIHTLSSRQ